ncbi:hypothetical protein [uncultured Gilliamella sp.]|uniref:hypothetical protein n=1 Tax=uncultured Gilliamella sp. TaxID=1193505 RepID=UPI0025E36C2E|nr:hypothetical protein [uncultured Gilliamella sp.]
MERAKQINQMQLVVGIPNNENSREESEGITNAELAMIHEFGVPERGIPERSFMRSTASEESNNLGQLSKQVLNECLAGNISPYDAYATIGAYFQGRIVEKITDGEFEPNNENTVKRKGSSKPLIDTGQLRASITYEVREK